MTYYDGTPYVSLADLEAEGLAKYGTRRTYQWRTNEVSGEGLGGDVVRSASDGMPGQGLAALPASEPVRYAPSPKAGFVIHLIGEVGDTFRKAKCGATRGRAWPRDPSDVTLLGEDRFCSKCWNKWAKERASD